MIYKIGDAFQLNAEAIWRIFAYSEQDNGYFMYKTNNNRSGIEFFKEEHLTRLIEEERVRVERNTQRQAYIDAQPLSNGIYEAYGNYTPGATQSWNSMFISAGDSSGGGSGTALPVRTGFTVAETTQIVF